jgi:capsular polysaccharide biosynthesis protein
MNDRSSSFHIAGVWEVIRRRLAMIASFVGFVLIIAALLLFFVIPKKYKSTAVIVAANPVLADKSRILNSNIQHLYSPYGTGDDLSRLEAIAALDTITIALVKEFDLENYYELTNDAKATGVAMLRLRKDLQVLKTPYDELHISATLMDRQLASNVVNRMVNLISDIAENSWRKEYTLANEALQQKIQQTELQLASNADSLKRTGAKQIAESITANKRVVLVEQLQQFYKASNEYELASAQKPASLVVLQNAYPAYLHDKPRSLEVLIMAFISALAFSIIAALIYEREKHF